MIKLVKQVLHSLNVKVSNNTIRETLFTHQSYPTLHCVSDAFDYWQIRHSIAKLCLDQLSGLDLPAIISSLAGNNLILIIKVTNTHVIYRDANNKLKNIKRELFDNQWNGISIIVEDTVGAGEKDYEQKKHLEKLNKTLYTLFACLFTICLLFLAYYNLNTDNTLRIWPKMVLLINNSLGLFICCLLYRKEKSLNIWSFGSLCKIGTTIDCNKVTKSINSKILLLHHITEIGAAYFAAPIIYILFIDNGKSCILPLFIYFIASLPIVIWSITKQLFYIKKICLFCCFVSVVIILNIVYTYFLHFNQNINITSTFLNISELIIIFILLAVSAIALDTIFTLKNKYFQIIRENASIKFNSITLKSQLSKHALKTPNVGFIWKNSNPYHEIAVYISTSCKHCQKILQQLNFLMEIYTNFNYKIIFDIGFSGTNRDESSILNYFYFIFLNYGKEKFFNVLEMWYNIKSKKLSELIKKTDIPLNSNNELFTTAQIEFCRTIQLDYFPAILIDGQVLSPMYNYKDLKNILQFFSVN